MPKTLARRFRHEFDSAQSFGTCNPGVSPSPQQVATSVPETIVFGTATIVTGLQRSFRC